MSKAGKSSYIKPYLLRNLKVTRSNQVWSIDITYVSMAHGHMYLVAIIDVFSRRILSWKLGNTLDASESAEVLQQAIARFGTLEILRLGEPVHERAMGRSLWEYYESQHGWSRTREGQHLD